MSIRTRKSRLVAAVALTAVAGLLATACSDDEKSSESTEAPASTEAPSGSDAPASTEAPAGTNLASILGWDNSLSGVQCKFGSVLALTGSGSFYGKTMSRAIDLAIEVIKESGGPQFTVKYWDHQSGLPEPGVKAMKEMVAEGISVKLASYVDDLGAMLGDTAANKVFTLDGGGGTSIFGQKVPYFWGTRAITPNDTLPGVFEWFKQTYPGKTKVGLLGWELGPLNDVIKQDVLAKIEAAGLEFNGLYELAAVGNTDFAQSITKIKANEPDLLIVSIYGQDPGSFINQAATAGIKSVMMGSEFTPDGVNASKGTYDSAGWTFAYDYFNPDAADLNPLGKYFVEKFRAKYDGESPDFYAANFFENTVRLWELMAEAKAAGATDDKLCVGETLNAAMEKDPTLVSVYGGSPTEVGTSTHDLVTHSVSKRPMGVFTYKAGKVTPLAYFGIGGEGFTLAS